MCYDLSQSQRQCTPQRLCWRALTLTAYAHLQGVVGGMPWNAIGYATMWAQALGFSDMAAATLTALFWGGTALGNLIGGLVGDLLVKPLPDAGRQLTCQVGCA